MNSQLEQRVDLIELNHFYDDSGRHSYDQIIFYEWAPAPHLPDDTRLWALLQQVGGGTWGGCVYDVDALVNKLSS